MMDSEVPPLLVTHHRRLGHMKHHNDPPGLSAIARAMQAAAVQP